MPQLDDHLDAMLNLQPGESYQIEGYAWRADEDGLLELWDPEDHFITAFLADELFIEINWPFEE